MFALSFRSASEGVMALERQDEVQTVPLATGNEPSVRYFHTYHIFQTALSLTCTVLGVSMSMRKGDPIIGHMNRQS